MSSSPSRSKSPVPAIDQSTGAEGWLWFVTYAPFSISQIVTASPSPCTRSCWRQRMSSSPSPSKSPVPAICLPRDLTSGSSTNGVPRDHARMRLGLDYARAPDLPCRGNEAEIEGLDERAVLHLPGDEQAFVMPP